MKLAIISVPIAAAPPARAIPMYPSAGKIEEAAHDGRNLSIPFVTAWLISASRLWACKLEGSFCSIRPMIKSRQHEHVDQK